MKIFRHPLTILIGLAIVAIFFSSQFAGCTKETIIKETIHDTLRITVRDTINKILRDTFRIKDTIDYDLVCPVRGMYIGTSTPNTGLSSNSIYTFEDNHFVVGRHEVNQGGVSFGGYRNTCDSVVWSVYYNVNSSYYLLKGKFSNNKNTISGSFKNLNLTSDFGTFTMSK